MNTTLKKLTLTIAMTLALVGAANATTYRFKVISPQKGASVTEWRTGDLDPGQEFFRVRTGQQNPGASITDFNPTADAALPVTVYEGGNAVLQGVPLVKDILKLFGF